MENELPFAALGAVLTLLIFTYLVGDNPFYRLALHIFVGASVAYVFVIALRGVILPALSLPDDASSNVRLSWYFTLVGVGLGLLLLTHGVRGLPWLSHLPVVILLGVGVGIAVGGTLVGTLLPQLSAAANPAVSPILEPLGQVIAVIGTITGLMTFSFSGRRPRNRVWNRLLNSGTRIGRWFILIGFGAAYGGVLVASLSFFADRVEYFFKVFDMLFGQV